uniref:GNAT family N-acetyltransferase n=1 Tax=Campylobacter sp. TaxID=205 RepID=UPI0027B9AC35
ADNCGAAEFASLSSENRSVIGKKSNAASEHSSAAAPNLSGEELVGFCVYRTEQTYKRAVSHHKQPPPRLNADKILRSKAHSGAEFDGAEDEIPGGEIKFSEAEFSNDTIGKIAYRKTQPFSGDKILNASVDSKISIAADCSTCGADGKISSSARRDEISSSAAESKISSIAAESGISRYDESEISSGGESGIFYVAYLGIDAKFRGLGVGSRLLALIAEQNPSAQIVLDVEPPHEDAPNLAQRLRRIEFYSRHGFRRCGKFFNYAGLSFEILAKPPLSAPQQGFDVASFVKFIGAGNKFRFKITDAPLYKN